MGAKKTMYPPDYGLMGGREELCVRFICPHQDVREPIRCKETGQEYPPPLSAPTLQQYCSEATMMELYRDARFAPYAAGQYLWEQLSYAMEYFPDDLYADASTPEDAVQMRERWLEIIAEILRFEDRTDRSRNRPSTIAMVERLIGMYENNEFSDAMQAMWNEAKRDIKKLVPNTWTPYMESEDIERKFRGPTPDELAERVAQWKQI